MSDPKVTPPISSFASMDNVQEYFLKEPFTISRDALYDYVQTNSGIFPKNKIGGSSGGGSDPDVEQLKEDVRSISVALENQRSAAKEASNMLSDIEEETMNYLSVDQIINSVITTKNSLSGYFKEIAN